MPAVESTAILVALTPGAHLDPYEIRFALGAGGMGEVYRAHGRPNQLLMGLGRTLLHETAP